MLVKTYYLYIVLIKAKRTYYLTQIFSTYILVQKIHIQIFFSAEIYFIHFYLFLNIFAKCISQLFNAHQNVTFPEKYVKRKYYFGIVAPHI